MPIDTAAPEDAEAIREVARAAWRAEYPLTRDTAETAVDEWYDPGGVRAAILDDDAVVLVASADGDGDDESDGVGPTIRGFAHAVFGPDRTEAAILRVYVRPTSRGTELGADLVTATLDRLRAAGAETVEAMALAANDDGNEFYRSLGFVLDRTEQTTIDGEAYEECVYRAPPAGDG